MKNWRAILHIMFLLGAGIFLGCCVIAWSHIPPAKANQLRPLMKEIEAYKATRGKYPISCTNFVSFSKITNQYSIDSVYAEYIPQGTILLEGHVSGWGIKEHDFTVLLNPNGYKIFIPIAGTQRNHTFSFDFAAWCYNSEKGRWQKGRIYNTSFGPYWKPSFFR